MPALYQDAPAGSNHDGAGKAPPICTVSSDSSFRRRVPGRPLQRAGGRLECEDEDGWRVAGAADGVCNACADVARDVDRCTVRADGNGHGIAGHLGVMAQPPHRPGRGIVGDHPDVARGPFAARYVHSRAVRAHDQRAEVSSRRVAHPQQPAGARGVGDDGPPSGPDAPPPDAAGHVNLRPARAHPDRTCGRVPEAPRPIGPRPQPRAGRGAYRPPVSNLLFAFPVTNSFVPSGLRTSPTAVPCGSVLAHTSRPPGISRPQPGLVRADTVPLATEGHGVAGRTDLGQRGRSADRGRAGFNAPGQAQRDHCRARDLGVTHEYRHTHGQAGPAFPRPEAASLLRQRDHHPHGRRLT